MKLKNKVLLIFANNEQVKHHAKKKVPPLISILKAETSYTLGHLVCE